MISNLGIGVCIFLTRYFVHRHQLDQEAEIRAYQDPLRHPSPDFLRLSSSAMSAIESESILTDATSIVVRTDFTFSWQLT